MYRTDYKRFLLREGVYTLAYSQFVSEYCYIYWTTIGLPVYVSQALELQKKRYRVANIVSQIEYDY